MKVCVIGAGDSGTEAALEAVRSSAEVTLVDSKAPTQPWSTWLELLRDGAQLGVGGRRRGVPPEASCVFGTKVASLDRGAATAEGGAKYFADAFVVATGSGYDRPCFEGRGKHGVRTLDSPGGYLGFGRDLASAEHVVVAGEGARSMQVAEKAARGGKSVTALLSTWQHFAPGPLAAKVMRDAAERIGVTIRAGRLGRALGSDRLEAVTTNGEVLTADALAVVPRRVPVRVAGESASGRLGGVSVGLDMRTTAPGVFGAGGCAELETGNPAHATLEDEQGVTGRIAGANASGSEFRVPAARRFSCALFGLLWTCIGTGFAPARSGGLDVDAFGQRQDESSSCAIVYDRARGAVLGVELVTRQAGGEPPLPSVGQSATLRGLAYDGTLGSSDISLVSETARLGLEAWSRS